MATSARLDELKKKFDENPRRYFAPLANEYRKLGDLTQAIAICRAHLPNQVGHISGHIVLAQALYEARELGEGRQVFEAALELDPENLIALRFLGDIAREQADPETARIWYERVLDADPRNDEISQLLRDLSRTPGSTGADDDLSTRPTPPATSSYASESFAPPGYREEAAAEAFPTEPEADDSGEIGRRQPEGVDSVVELPYELPTQGEDPFSTVRHASHAPALEDPFATEPSPYDGALSLGELEAVAEPSIDDWFAPSAAETSRSSEHPTPAFTDSFFPDLDAPSKVSSGFVPELSPDIASREPEDAFEDAFAPSVPSELAGMPQVSSEDVTPPYVPAVDAFPAEENSRSSDSREATIAQPSDAESAWSWNVDAHDAPSEYDSATSSTVPQENESELTDRPTPVDAIADRTPEPNTHHPFGLEAPSDHNDASSEPFAAITANPMDDPFVVMSDDVAPGDESWAPTDVAPIEGLLSMEAGAAPIGADPRVEPVDGEVSNDLESGFFMGEEQAVSSQSDDAPAPRFIADPIFGRTPTLEALEPEPTPAAFVTETMAELYMQQGFTQEALEIYRQLLSRSPKDELLRERVAALESGSTSTILPSADPLPPTDREGQSVRSFFARFARRQPSRRPPPPGGNDHDEGEGATAASPSSETTIVTARTSERFAGAATRDEALTVPDRSSSAPPTLSQLFAGAPASRDDDAAATALASAFTGDVQGASGMTASAPASTSGERELSLEHLFRDVPARSAGAVTLDEFYASSTTPASDPTPDRAEETGERDADIEQFTAWLEGLKKK